MAALPHLWPLARKASNSVAILQERAGWLCSAEQLVKIAWLPAGREKVAFQGWSALHSHEEDLWVGGKGFVHSQLPHSPPNRHPSPW